jgi:hypothetical protein
MLLTKEMNSRLIVTQADDKIYFIGGEEGNETLQNQNKNEVTNLENVKENNEDQQNNANN